MVLEKVPHRKEIINMYLILSLIIICSSNIYSQCQGDVNDDGIKNVVDVVLIVDDILSGNTA